MSMKHPGQDNFVFGIIVGGDSEDPASDKAGGMRLHIPHQYGPNIDPKKLPFVRMLAQGTQDGVTSFNPPPERGTPVLAVKHGGSYPGTGHATVLGVLPNDIQKSVGIPGGKSLFSVFEDAVNHVTNKKAPPTSLKNGQRDGAEIRQVQDGKMWSNALTKNIPSTTTAWPMSGIPLPPVQGVHTATQHFSNILSGSMLSSLPGTAMSLGTMFTTMASNGMLDQVKAVMDPEAIGALESMSNLITSVETAESAGFAVGNRVHEETFLNNALDLLSSARNVGDIIDVLHRLQYDTSLHGLDLLEDVVVVANTPFGNNELIISYTGSVKSNVNVSNLVFYANGASSNTVDATSTGGGSGSTSKNILNFLNMMTSPEQAFSMSGKNMFGDSAKTKFDMFNRMNGGALGTAKSLIETLNTGNKEKNGHRKIAKLVRDGGKLLSGKGFKA